MFGAWLKKLPRGKPPEHAEVLLEKLHQEAVRAYRRQAYAEAARCAEQAIGLDPRLANAHFLLGSARLGLGQFQAAEESLAACLALGPRFPTVLNAELQWALARARTELVLGKVPQATLLKPDEIRPVSIIICSIDAERFAKVCETYRSLLKGVPHDIVGIHDARSLCEGYNRGTRQATGEILVFSHDDIEILTPDFAAKLLTHLAKFELIGIAGTTRLTGPSWTYAGWTHTHGQIGYPMATPGHINVCAWQMREAVTANAEALDGVLLAARREVVERVGFDERTFDGWHLYDIDFTYRAHLAGFRVAICHDLLLVHHSPGDFGADWQRYALRFTDKHRATLPSVSDALEFPPVCAIEANSPAEWRLMTDAITSQKLPSARSV